MPGEAAIELAALRLQLAGLRQARDSTKPVTNRILNAKRLVDRRVAAAGRATVAREKALEALAQATKTYEEAMAAEAAAHTATGEAQQELHQLGFLLAAEPTQDADSGAPSDEDHWDTITGVLSQLQQLPSAMAAGNGNAAWLSIQANGLQQLQQAAEKRAFEKLQRQEQQEKQQQRQQLEQQLRQPLPPQQQAHRKAPRLDGFTGSSALSAPRFDGFTGLPVPSPEYPGDKALFKELFS